MAVPAPSRPAVLHLARPAPALLEAALSASKGLPFSYAEVGATRGELPVGADHDTQAMVVGRGEVAWRAAVAAIRAWKQFDLDWVHLHRDDTPIAAGALVAFASRQLGLWAVNVCRVVYVVEEADSFGFAYGTLAGHVVAGEEQFLLLRDPVTDEVTFRIRKFSRPHAPLVRLASPLARGVQRRFTLDALDALARAVEAR